MKKVGKTQVKHEASMNKIMMDHSSDEEINIAIISINVWLKKKHRKVEEDKESL